MVKMLSAENTIVLLFSSCKIHASLFLSSSGPYTMVREAFLTDVDVC